MVKFVDFFMPTVVTVTFVYAMVFPAFGCYSSISSFGTTYPVGDISRIAGSDLVINCTLNDNYTGPSDSTDIGWNFEKTEVPNSLISIIDTRTAQLRVKNITTSNSGKYNCILRSSATSLCLNVVVVGVPPPKIDENNFHCRSEEWKNLTCRWNVLFNPTFTNWTLYYRQPQGIVRCPVHEWYRGSHRCLFNESTFPPYRQAAPFFYFILIGNNTYGTSMSQFKVDHFKNVVPSPPEEFNVLPFGATSLRTTWAMDSVFKLFPVPLVFRLRYRSQWDPINFYQKVEVTNLTSYMFENMVPHTKYEFIIKCRSERASENETMWSPELKRTFQTQAEVPIAQLETVTGGFDDVNVDMDRRNITIYWKSLSENLYYGPNFTYTIRVYENNLATNIRPVLITNLSAKFYALHKSRSYTFGIRSSNSVGISKMEGTIYVDKSTNKPDLPEGFSVIYYYRGIYELSWHRPRRSPDQQLIDYTAFWCKSHRQMLDPCNSSVEWQRVDAGVHVVNITVSDSSSNYRFALAANGKTASSGIVWAKCMALFNGVLGKIKMLPLKVNGPDKIEINWVVDCLDRTGRIVGFNISFCIFDNRTNSCKDGHPEYEFVPDCTKTSHVLSNLRPFTMYSVSVAAKTKSGDGEPCDAQQAMTFEGAPGSPPQHVHLESVTNHSITLVWKSPSDPNGIITYYEIEYGDEIEKMEVPDYNSVNGVDDFSYVITRNVRSYTAYAIRLMACTVKGCSNSSTPVVVTTDIGVPGQPDPPKVRLLNATHAIVSWEFPGDNGGPIERWRLLVTWKTSETSAMSNMTLNMNNVTTCIVPVRCDGLADDTEYFFAVSAVNIKSGEILVGNWSDFSAVNACFAEMWMGFSVGEVVGVVVVVGAFLGLLIYGFVSMAKIVKSKVQEMQTMKVDLPEGLIEGSFGGYGGFKRNLASEKNSSELATSVASVRPYGRLQSVSSDEGRSSQESGTTFNMTSSMNSINDETLYSEKGVNCPHDYDRLQSCESRGCSSIVGSVSSSITVRTHLSSDSGTEVDLVFLDSPIATVIPTASDWTAASNNSVSLVPPTLSPSTSNCQLRLRSSTNMQSSDNNESSDCEIAIAETTLMANDNNKHISKSTNPLPIDSANQYSKVTKNKQPIDLDDRSKITNTSIDADNNDAVNPYNVIDLRPELGQGYVCVGVGDPSDTEITSRTRKNRKISLPMGVVTKINSPNQPSDVAVTNAVGSYVTVASMDGDKVEDTSNEISNTLPTGYSKFATVDNISFDAEKRKDNLQSHQLPNVDFVLSGTNDKCENDGYVTAVSLDDYAVDFKPCKINPSSTDLLTAGVVMTNNFGDRDGDVLSSSSWEKDLEDSEENVTEEDLMSVSPIPVNGYVKFTGVNVS